MTEHYYAWVRVGNGDPEPAAITGKKPHRKATTFGCPDTFDVDRADSGCSIILAVRSNYLEHVAGGSNRHDNLWGRASEATIENPFSDDEHDRLYEIDAKDAAQREKDYQREIKYQPHNYAGFGRKERGIVE
jgi:hypothetical protein